MAEFAHGIFLPGETGLTLTARLIDTEGNQVGGTVTDGFVELGDGAYMLTVDIPDGFRGALIFRLNSEIKGFVLINPEEYELIGTINTKADQILTELDTAYNGLLEAIEALDFTVPDVFGTELPGSYPAGTAGFIIGSLSGTDVVGISTPSISASGDIELIKGTDYTGENKIVFSEGDVPWPSFGNGSLYLTVFGQDIDAEAITDSSVAVEIDDEITQDLPLGRYRYFLRLKLVSGEVRTLTQGRILFV